MKPRSTVAFIKRRKLKRDLRNEAEQSNLTFRGAWILKTLLLAIGYWLQCIVFRKCRRIETGLLCFFVVLLNLITPGSCSQDFLRVANVGDTVILWGTTTDEYGQIWDWQFSPSKGSLHPLPLCSSEKPPAANYSIYGECSREWIRIQSAADYHDGTFTFTRYLNNGSQDLLKYQLSIFKGVTEGTTLRDHMITEDTMDNKSRPATNPDEKNGTKDYFAVGAGIAVPLAIVLVGIGVILFIMRKRIYDMITKTYNPVNPDPPPEEGSVKYSKEKAEFIEV